MPLITCSSLTRYCRYEKVLKSRKPRSESADEAAALGTQFHGLVEAWLLNRTADADISPVALEWFAALQATWTPPDRVQSEVALGMSPMGHYVEVEENPPGSHVYVALTGERLLTAGRADLLWRDGETLYVADLKTGRTHLGDPGSLPQLMALGLAAADKHGCSRLLLGIYYARDAAWEWSEPIELAWDRQALFDEVARMATMGDEPRPGPWCASCWERRGCEHASDEEAA